MGLLVLFIVIGIAGLAYDYYYKNYAEAPFIEQQKQAIRKIKTNPKLVEIEDTEWYAQYEAEQQERALANSLDIRFTARR